MRAVKYLTILILSTFLLGATCVRIKADPLVGAVEGNDFTAMVEGCGHQLVSGYAFCRKREGDASKEVINLVAPAAQCADDKSCVEWKILYQDGSPAIGGVFPKGKTRVEVLWKDLLRRDTFELGDGGFWGIMYTIRWVDENGFAKKTVVKGELRLIVNRKDYLSLSETSDDAAFAWAWNENGVNARMTTGGRAFVGAKR